MINKRLTLRLKRTFNRFPLAVLALALVFASCKSDDDPEPQPEANYTAELNTAADVILTTYSDLATRASVLKEATVNLEAEQTEANLEAAREAWVAARAPWEKSEGFLFGPVDQEGLDPALDSWPVNVTDLNNVLNSGDPITPEFLAAQEGTLKGFHTIEFLLWGDNLGNPKPVTEISQREFEYLSAASTVLAQNAQQLYDAWRPGAGNYVDNLKNAGNGSQIYVSQKGALEEMANAMAGIADEVGNGKINDPYTQQDLTLEESRFSANSKNDFADNIRSIRNIYSGIYGDQVNGKSMSNIISEADPALDAQIKSEIDAAITSIENIPGTFSDAVFNAPQAVEDAQTKVRTLQETLESQLTPYISGL